MMEKSDTSLIGSVYSIVSSVYGFFNPVKHSVNSPNIKEEIEHFSDTFVEILKEKDLIQERIEQSWDELTNTLRTSPKFQESPEQTEAFYKAHLRFKEISQNLILLITTYPVYDVNQAKLPGYSSDLEKQLTEHHINIKTLADTYFEEIKTTISLFLSNNTNSPTLNVNV